MLYSWIAKRRNAYSGVVDKEIEFPVGDGLGSYLTHEIEGLGPGKVGINSIDLATDPGGLILSSRGEMRNIVIKASFSPDWENDRDEGALRRLLYPIFAPGNRVELDFNTDNPGLMRIQGVVETFEPIIWINEPWVTISILCEDPYFRIPGQQIVTNLPSNMASFEVDMPYDVATGFEFQITSSASGASSTETSLVNLNTGKRTGWTGVGRNSGDVYVIDTRRGSRKIQRTRGTTTSLLNGYLRGTLSDMVLVPGINYFTLSQAATFTSGQIRYQPLYLGI